MCDSHAVSLVQVWGKEGRIRKRCIALTRRGVGRLHMIVNCAPARGCVWPVVAPAGAWVGAYRAAGRCGSVAASCVRFTPAVCRVSAKQDGLRCVMFLFPPWVGIAISAFSNVVRLSGLDGSLRDCAFLAGDSDGERSRVYEKERRDM